ncbi:Adenosylhomocysteinase [Streptomyces sp. ADI96-02]|uniref:adenosylhomocysteinase n=1 Tax=unclassified Streptomyces TaxID=2593676 RepID=UPI000F54D544|nr:adenosylhomocysteinase [Streptomyces sp. ADI96-02]RPK54547.1 Adenosylhomocysteinase [Streptomyces sp. ADI96-02]
MSLPFLSAVRHDGTDWALRHMPLLRETVRRHGAVLAGKRIAMCLHIEPKTAALVALLTEAGAEVTLTGSPGTTQDDTADALRASGTTVYGRRDDTPDRHRHHIDRVLACDPHLLLDNGGDLTVAALEGGGPPHLVGGTEETTTGALRIRALPSPPPFPVVVINDSRLKLLVENEFGVGQSVVQGFMNATNLMLPGARATVVGYGPCGLGVANTLARLGARVSVAETDPYRALEAVMHGHEVGPLDTLLPRTRLLFLATGHPGVVGADQLDALADGTIVAGVGHRAWEVDQAALAARTASIRRYGTAGDERAVHRLSDGREITVLAGTAMINLTAAKGNPIQAMDLGLTLQARSLAAVAALPLAPGAQPVPADVDREIAASLVARLTAD